MKKCTSYKIEKIIMRKELDYDPDLSFYGKYTNSIGPGVIIRQYNEFYERIPTEMERDECGRFIGKMAPEWDPHYLRNEYPGFKPFASGEKVGTKEYYEYGMQDYERMEDYNRGGWCMVVVVLTAYITTDTGLSDTIHATLSGVESDSGADYFEEIKRDLSADLKADLLKMGFSEDEITTALSDIQEVD